MVSLHFDPYPTLFYLTAFESDFTAQKLRAFPFFDTNVEIALPVLPAKPSFYVEYKVSDTNNRILKAKFEAITHSFAEQSHTQLPPNQKACVCHPPSPLLTESECQNDKGSYGLFSSHSLNKLGEGPRCRNRTVPLGTNSCRRTPC